MTRDQIIEELKKCQESPVYFYNHYVKLIYKDGKEIVNKLVMTEEQIKAYENCRRIRKRIA